VAKTKELPIGEARDLVDIGIITMKDEEFAAVLKRFPAEEMTIGRSIYPLSTFSDSNNQHHHAAIVRTAEQGDISAHFAVRALIDDLKPDLIILIGIAGARPAQEYTLGDVIVATRMYDFNVQAAAPDGTVEYTTRSAPAHLLAQLYASNLVAFSDVLGDWNSDASIGMPSPPVKITKTNIFGDSAWIAKVRSALEHNFDRSGKKRLPIAFSGAIGSGSILVKDPKVLQEWLTHARDLRAVDMEIAGVYEAARSIDENLPVITIRGISDIVGFRRDIKWTEYACNSAASFLYSFVSVGILSSVLRKRPRVSQSVDVGKPTAPFEHPSSRRSSSNLSILSLPGANFVRPGINNYTKDAPFGFEIRRLIPLSQVHQHIGVAGEI
jgi:nucleoside phosphorylase